MKLIGPLADLAAAAGVGALAGIAGTAAMTISSTLEAKIRRCELSDTPAVAAGNVLGVRPRNDTTKKRFNTIAHCAASPAWTWGAKEIGAKEIGIDLFHHGVYAAVTSAVYERLSGPQEERSSHQ